MPRKNVKPARPTTTLDLTADSPPPPAPSPAPEAVPETLPARKARVPRPKFTFMLHDVDTLVPAHRFTAPGFREAANKAASKGHARILLRKCGTSEVRAFSGSCTVVDPPVVVPRRGAEHPIVYHKKPSVRYESTTTLDEIIASRSS